MSVQPPSRGDATVRRIRHAALKLFAERGRPELTVSDLAVAAGLARGTIYSHLEDARVLFEELAEHLVDEMSRRLARAGPGTDDPAALLAYGIRQYVRRGHDEPEWGRFVTRFAYTSRSLQRLWVTGPGDHLKAGIRRRRFSIRSDQSGAAMAMLAGAVIATIAAVLDGELGWRSAGSLTAEMLLVAFGVDRAEARSLAALDLPPLPPPL